MKKLSSLFIIILLLLSSCQIESGKAPETTIPTYIADESVTQVYEEFTETTLNSLPSVIDGSLPSQISDATTANQPSSANQIVTQAGTTAPATQKVTTPSTQKTTAPTTQKTTVPTTQAKPVVSSSEMRAIWIS